MKLKKQQILSILSGLLLLAGTCMLLYPAAAELQNASRSSRVTADYVSAAGKAGTDDVSRMLADAAAFNGELAGLANRWSLPAGMKETYYESLDISGTGVIGNVIIPKIGVNLPVYHGNADRVLSVAAGHMEGSSFPIGGEGTHAVITGHTGMASADLFTDLDELECGDEFFLSVLGQQLAYEVSAINTVLPDEMGYLDIQEGKDLVTLLTCTPRGVNSHRLLVTGTRKAKDVAETVPVAPQNVAERLLFAGLGLILMASGGVGLYAQHKKYRKE